MTVWTLLQVCGQLPAGAELRKFAIADWLTV